MSNQGLIGLEYTISFRCNQPGQQHSFQMIAIDWEQVTRMIEGFFDIEESCDAWKQLFESQGELIVMMNSRIIKVEAQYFELGK